MSDIAPDQFGRNQYYLKYYQRTTIIDECAFICWPTPQMSVHVCLGRDKQSGRRFSIRELSSMKQVLPIVDSLVCEQFKGAAGNWPFGAAASMILLSLVLIVLTFYARSQIKDQL